MSKTIVALYDDRTDAESALRDLESDGFERNAIAITSHADRMAVGDAPREGGFLSQLTGWGVPDQDAHVYAEGVRRGGSLLKIRLDDADVDRALAVLERGKVIDIEERGGAYRASGWAGYDETSSYYDERSVAEERARYAVGQTTPDVRLSSAAEALRDTNTAAATSTGREEQIPIVEETLNVGKRSVERGGVRVRSYIVETPVEETIRLRDETVTVERRPGDQAALGSVPADAFRERTIEVTETDEEAVVEKAAYVRETLVVRKDVEDRTETVRDTVRRTEVEVDDARKSGSPVPGARPDSIER
ncbi:YsnF/AvaK domain-containing protein [Azospirillum doebereinerae]|uniref:YsnF/AvaK domain-containing protein n=1 Tax=Azospirillum doebereinerae TaxID=92933 RepID=UPI001EE61A5C|nr:YsnF/AvaK domain-containing protein [Azospirillum doebereinerae]MCG5239845.1 YsnF/AvaK domain-containing protein [Azospirillum doebereinerae]